MRYDGKYQEAIIDGLSVSVNLPYAVKQKFDSDGNEVSQGLPPYAPVDLAVVDEYKGSPDTWMRGTAKTGSFFFPVKEGRGLWLDFNSNISHKHHVAIVVSIQGINAITGQKMIGFKPRLERYDTKCPIHDTEFGHDRFCEQCGFKWPAQNYLATTSTPYSQFWLDGFRNQNGEIRQFIFTPEEMERGVAQNLIGNERIFAIGIAFFLSKKPKPVPVYSPALCRDIGNKSIGDMNNKMYSWSSHMVKNKSMTEMTGHFIKNCVKSDATGQDFIGYLDNDEDSLELCSVDETKFEVGAGARVQQSIHSDTEEIGFWQDEPTAVLYMNYADEKTIQAILNGPRVDMTAGGEGFMKNIPTGDPPQGQSV